MIYLCPARVMGVFKVRYSTSKSAGRELLEVKRIFKLMRAYYLENGPILSGNK